MIAIPKSYFSDKLPFTTVKFVHFSPLINSDMLHFATLTRKFVFLSHEANSTISRMIDGVISVQEQEVQVVNILLTFYVNRK